MQMLNLLLFSILLSSTTARKMCDMNKLSPIFEACKATFDADTTRDRASRDRVSCACIETIPLEHRDCYVALDEEDTLQEWYELRCGENLLEKKALEEQVGIMSYLSGCGDPAEAYCYDEETSTGCGTWTTHKFQYNNKCGWPWDREPCDRCCENEKNIIDEDTKGMGGVCTCPDGFSYDVGSASNCIDGTLSPAKKKSKNKVTCYADYIPRLKSADTFNTIGCDGSDICGFSYILDQTIGMDKVYEMLHSSDRNEVDKSYSLAYAKDDRKGEDGDGWHSWLQGGANTHATTQIKGSMIWHEDGDWNDISLKLEMIDNEFYVDSKIVARLGTGDLVPNLEKTQVKGKHVNHGSPVPATVAYHYGKNIWIVGGVDHGKLKMVKIEINGPTDFNWIASAYTTESGCFEPEAFSEQGGFCFDLFGYRWNRNYDLALVAEAEEVEIEKEKKISIGPELKIADTVWFHTFPVIYSIKAQPVATVTAKGSIGAEVEFTIENAATFGFSDIFLELDLSNFKTYQNLDKITATKAYSDMYTLDIGGSVGLEISAVIGIEVEFMLYDTIGVSLTPSIEAKFEASAEASLKQRWSSTVEVPPLDKSHKAQATICVGSTVQAGLTWAGDDLEAAISAVKDKLSALELQKRRRQLTRPLDLHSKRRRLNAKMNNLIEQGENAYTAINDLQEACKDVAKCTTGWMSSSVDDVCEIDFSEIWDQGIDLIIPDSWLDIDLPEMTVPIHEQCLTVGNEDGENFRRGGNAEEVSCGGGVVAMSCSNCLADGGSCGGDCAMRWDLVALCVPAEEEFGIFPGALCGDGYEPVVESREDCTRAGKILGYSESKIKDIKKGYKFGDARPQGCFVSGISNQVLYNPSNGPEHGKAFKSGDAIICKKPEFTSTETSVGYLSMLDGALGYSSDNFKQRMLIFFALIGFFATIVFAYNRAFQGKYTTIQTSMAEEI